MAMYLWIWRAIFAALSIGFVFAAFGEFAKYAVDSHNEPSNEVVAYAQSLSVFLAAAGLCLSLLAVAPVRFRLLAIPGVLCAVGMAVRYVIAAQDSMGVPQIESALVRASFFAFGAILLSIFLYTVRQRA